MYIIIVYLFNLMMFSNNKENMLLNNCNLLNLWYAFVVSNSNESRLSNPELAKINPEKFPISAIRENKSRKNLPF